MMATKFEKGPEDLTHRMDLFLSMASNYGIACVHDFDIRELRCMKCGKSMRDAINDRGFVRRELEVTPTTQVRQTSGNETNDLR